MFFIEGFIITARMMLVIYEYKILSLRVIN